MASTQPPSASTTATGTLTFLFTDIEGSTKRWERHPELMAKAVARHDAIMREAITANNGHVFKTVGDAFCAVFPSAEDAIHASVAAQRAIAAEDWGEIGPLRVRMGLHTGEAEERDADYFGPTVNRVARIASAGHGGQTLLSGTTGDHAGERLPPEVRVRDLGRHRLKDLARPERILQLIGAGLPTDFPKLKTVPSPAPGIAAAVLSTLAPLVLFRVANRSSSEEVNASLLSPLSLYTGLKGLVIELSTINEYVLLAVGVLLLAIAGWIGVARWRAARREQRLHRRDEPGRVARWVVNQRTVAFFAVLALLVLGAWGYQQYLWRVALPVPDDALGIAMTREASAAIVQEQLADSLYEQGQAERIVMRELPVVFDARDTDRARALGDRIGAHAVIIYRTDETASGDRQYLAYVVFTDPTIGLSLAGSAENDSQALVVKEGVPVPVLRTDSLEELVNAAAGIIAYDTDQPRRAIEYLELAVPDDPDAANSGIVNFYLGNAYNLDNQTGPAIDAWENAASFYEQRIDAGEILGPQDQLILAKAYLERGRASTFRQEWDEAIGWYERAVALRADILARSEGLERPTDVHATYARLYTEMADVYRFKGLSEDARSWSERAIDEIGALTGQAAPNDDYVLVQQSASWAFTGDCVRARSVLDRALELDPADTNALTNAGIIALLQQRPDLARAYLQRIIEDDPNNVPARMLLAQTLILDGLTRDFTEPALLQEAEALYREVIAIDPTNVAAHHGLASLGNIRAESLMIDSTAVTTGDDLSVARSQATWPQDTARREATLDVYAEVIDTRRIVAAELEPDAASAAVAVAEAYAARQRMLYTALVGPLTEGQAQPEAESLGEQVLADAAQVHEWTQRVFDNPDATRLDRIRAWAALVESLDREWGWQAFVEQDEERAAELEQDYRDAVAEAVTFVEAEPLAALDAIAPTRIVYSKAWYIASVLDANTEVADRHWSRIQELSERELTGRGEGITHYRTICRETREEREAAALLERGDADGARERFDAALDANPSHVPSLLGSARLLRQQGNPDEAVDRATTATEVAPDLPTTWAGLATSRLAAGDTDAALDALDRFLALIAARPEQERLSLLRTLLEDLHQIAREQPERRPAVLETINPIGEALDAMPEAELASYQLPMRYEELGELALHADGAANAEPWLRRALELDPQSLAAHANLVIALLAEDEPATGEIDRAIAAVEDPYWQKVIDFEDPQALLALMQEEIDAYVDRFPDREDALEPLTSAMDETREAAEQPATGVEGSTFTGEASGFALSWGDSWSVVESSSNSPPGVDSLQLGNGASVLQLASTAGHASTAGCLDAVVGAVEADPAFATVVPARIPGGDAAEGSSARLAHASFVDGTESETSSVYWLACLSTSDNGSIVLAMAIVPIDGYAEQREEVNAVLGTLRATDAGTEEPAERIELPEIDLDAR